ncbi:MAG: polysaccharide deacetylase family protein [bacterium]|nr:polysaccharide deacetylase family protein [bacterium]
MAEVSTTGAATPDTAVSSTDAEDPVDAVPVTTVLDTSSDPVAASVESAVGGPDLLNSIQISGLYRPDMNVRVDDGVTRALVTGTVGSRPQVYALAGKAGQKLEAALAAPPGVSLEVRHGDEVLYVGHDEPRRLETTLARGGDLALSVTSSGEEPGEYKLTIRIGPPDPEPVRSTPSTRTARRSIRPGDVVYLTFDDGPNPNHTPEVLDILARHGARATFFVIGSLVERYPGIFQRIVAEGHTVANHTWRHENLARLTKAEFDETISRTEEILGDHATPCLRPPYAATGSHTREWAAEYGLEVHLWSVSANDWLGLNATEIANRIESQVTAGSVVLMHDGGGNRTQTVRGLEMLLDRLADLDLRYEPLCV